MIPLTIIFKICLYLEYPVYVILFTSQQQVTYNDSINL